MGSHASSQPPHPPSPEAGTLRHVRPFERSLSNLSQASTLVGLEYDSDDHTGSLSRTRAQLSGHHDSIKGLHPHEPCAPHQANIDDAFRYREASHEVSLEEYQRTHQLAAKRVSWLYRVCEPLIMLIGDISAMLGAADRLNDAGEQSAAYRLYQEILQDQRLP